MKWVRHEDYVLIQTSYLLYCTFSRQIWQELTYFNVGCVEQMSHCFNSSLPGRKDEATDILKSALETGISEHSHRTSTLTLMNNLAIRLENIGEFKSHIVTFL